MINIFLGGLLSFFAAFGMIEMVRRILFPAYRGVHGCHLTVLVKDEQETVEGTLRSLLFDSRLDVIAVDVGSADDTLTILQRLQQRYPTLAVLTLEEYIEFLLHKD